MTMDQEIGIMPDETFAFFHKIADHIRNGDTVDETLASAVKLATALVSCDECCTFVRQGKELIPWVWKHVSCGSLDRTPIAIGKGFAAALAIHGQPVAESVSSAQGNVFRVFKEWSSDLGETFVAIPFISRSKLVGAMTLHHRQPRPYNRQEYRLLASVGCFVGADLGISQLERENSELLLELETHKLVERSKGILQRELGLSAHEAFVALQRQSQEKRRPLKEIAQAIILSAEVKQSARTH
jgi:signal transduction protein with GAF and PtsI domain